MLVDIFDLVWVIIELIAKSVMYTFKKIILKIKK